MSSREALLPGRIAVLLAVGVIAAVVGGAVIGGAEVPTGNAAEPEPDEIVERMVDEANEHGDVHGTFTLEYVADGEQHERRSEMWDRDGTDHHRYLIHESTDDRSPDGRLVVSDGETLYTYDPRDEEATKYDLDEGNVTFPQAEYTHYGQMTGSFELEYAGRETIAGRDAHHVRFTLPTSEPDGIHVVLGETEYAFPVGSAVDDEYVFEGHSLYVDVERAYPLAERVHLADADGERTTFARTLESVRFDAEFDDDRFTFEPPTDTDVTEHEFGETASFDSIDAAAETVSFELAAASAPDGLAVDEVTVRNRNENTTVRVTYRSETVDVESGPDDTEDRNAGAVGRNDTDPDSEAGANDSETGTNGSETDSDGREADSGGAESDVAVSISEERTEPAGVTAQVGDREATVTNTMSGVAVHWECDGLQYTVYGEVTQPVLFDVAESIESTACSDPS